MYEHAVALARRYPDVPLPGNGEPFPNDRARDADETYDSDGTLTAGLIDGFFSTPVKHRDIAGLCRQANGFRLPLHRKLAIAAAIGRTDPDRARELGRHLTRRSSDENPTVLGMAILTEVGTEEDVSLIQTIGLLSNTFGSLAAEALVRLPHATANLIWLADRAAGWGRVYLVEAICRLGDPAAERWLLSKPCDGNHLNSYFAHQVACAAPVHEAIAVAEVDEEVVDHTGRLLVALVWGTGMGGTLLDYVHAEQVLADYFSHLCRLDPSRSRNYAAQTLCEFLNGEAYLQPPEWESLDSLRIAYRSLVTVGGGG
ncbi:hypothetical protein [Nocardia tengchongensis]|uniref:hypothetical protein n=1 Tax=Nocardia tengchongensis TaxID=2055889 RepID=UPI0036ACEBA8